MSALGQKQTLPRVVAMSALPPKADIHRRAATASNGLDARILIAAIFVTAVSAAFQVARVNAS